MNDFTKEELLEIYGLLEHHYCDPEKCLNPNTKLLLKLESMIVNYCDHQMGYDSGEFSSCRKCGHRE